MKSKSREAEEKLLELYTKLSDEHKELAIHLLRKLLDHQQQDHE